MATISEALAKVPDIQEFIPRGELNAILRGMYGEEAQHFIDIVMKLADRIKNMPVTYEQEGKGQQAIAYLHYFQGGSDWYITEKDKGDDESTAQYQAFGQAALNGCYPEMGYISIVELVQNGIELDLYFEPRTLEEINKEA